MNFITSFFQSFYKQTHDQTVAPYVHDIMEKNKGKINEIMKLDDDYQKTNAIYDFVKSLRLSKLANELTPQLQNKEVFSNVDNSFFTHVEINGGKYVTCPKPSGMTFVPYWSFVFNHVDTIVNLYNSYEDVSETCDLYPSFYSKREMMQNCSKEYADVKVAFQILSERIIQLTEERIIHLTEEPNNFLQFNEYMTETIVRLSIAGSSKTVTVYSVRNWIDMTAPHPDILAKMVKNVPKSNKPILIHCKAGEGRTGLFMLAHAFQENHINTVSDGLNYAVEKWLNIQLQGAGRYIHTQVQFWCLFNFMTESCDCRSIYYFFDVNFENSLSEKDLRENMLIISQQIFDKDQTKENKFKTMDDPDAFFTNLIDFLHVDLVSFATFLRIMNKWGRHGSEVYSHILESFHQNNPHLYHNVTTNGLRQWQMIISGH